MATAISRIQSEDWNLNVTVDTLSLANT